MDYAIKIDSRRGHGLTVLEISDTLKIFTDAVTMLIESLHNVGTIVFVLTIVAVNIGFVEWYLDVLIVVRTILLVRLFHIV